MPPKRPVPSNPEVWNAPFFKFMKMWTDKGLDTGKVGKPRSIRLPEIVAREIDALCLESGCYMSEIFICLWYRLRASMSVRKDLKIEPNNLEIVHCYYGSGAEAGISDFVRMFIESYPRARRCVFVFATLTSSATEVSITV